MDIVELIARSEWPIVVGGIMLLFRGPIRKMIDRINLTKIDAFGISAEFEKGLEKVEQLTPPLLPDKSQPKIVMDEKSSASERRSPPSSREPQSPEATVLAAWSFIEADMRAMMDAIRPTKIGHLGVPPINIAEAGKRLGLSQDEIASLMTLRDLRNKVAHSAETSLTWDEATRFREATERLLARMKKNWEEIRKK